MTWQCLYQLPSASVPYIDLQIHEKGYLHLLVNHNANAKIFPKPWFCCQQISAIASTLFCWARNRLEIYLHSIRYEGIYVSDSNSEDACWNIIQVIRSKIYSHCQNLHSPYRLNCCLKKYGNLWPSAFPKSTLLTFPERSFTHINFKELGKEVHHTGQCTTFIFSFTNMLFLGYTKPFGTC